MNRLQRLTSIVILASLVSCQDTIDNADSQARDLEFFRSIGKKIPTEMGYRWIDMYNHNHPGGRVTRSDYSLTAEELQQVVDVNSGLTGIAFHHAYDELGIHHFLIIPIDESLQLWNTAQGKIYIDANTGTTIQKQTARAWAENYATEHAGEILFHYFGRNIFEEILHSSIQGEIAIVPALKDTDLSPQLLLIVTSDDDHSGGRTNSQTTVYDASSPCPPCGVN